MQVFTLSFTLFIDHGILERHKQLDATIGALEIEMNSLHMSQMFAWIFYPIWMVLAFLQGICFVLSNGRFHPLAIILRGRENKTTGNIG